MSNANYRGTSQPYTGSGGGWLARIGSVLGGGGTPTYRGDGQPSSGARGFLGAATPQYVDPSARPDCDGVTHAAPPAAPVAEPMIVWIDRDALIAGQIAIIELAPGKLAIVVPRDGCARESALDPAATAVGTAAVEPSPQ